MVGHYTGVILRVVGRRLVEETWSRVACAQKTTATAIFKPVSRPTISQWRKADPPTKPVRVIPHVDCHIITILSLLWTLYSWLGAMFKLYLYNITVFNSQFLSCWQSMAYGWSPTQPARVILTCIVPYYYNFVFIIETAEMAQYLNYIFITLPCDTVHLFINR